MEGIAIKQINTYALYQLAKEVAPLRKIPLEGAALTKENAFPLFLANFYINKFFIEDQVMPLELSGDAAPADVLRRRRGGAGRGAGEHRH